MAGTREHHREEVARTLAMSQGACRGLQTTGTAPTSRMNKGGSAANMPGLAMPSGALHVPFF